MPMSKSKSRPTSTLKSNIEKILRFNSMGSVAEINKLETVELPLGEISGYIDIGMFTKNALNLISWLTPALNNRADIPKSQEKLLKIAKEEDKFVDLDAIGAGEFASWIFPDFGCVFVRSIRLRFENQVYHFGSSDLFGFSMAQVEIDDLVTKARLDARFRSIDMHLENADPSLATSVYSIKQDFTEIRLCEEELKRIDERVRELRKNIAEANSDLRKQRDSIMAKDAKFPIREIMPVDSDISVKSCFQSDQNFSFAVLTQTAVNGMKARNEAWYGGQGR